MEKLGNLLTIIGLLLAGFCAGIAWMRNRHEGNAISLEEEDRGGIGAGIYGVFIENDTLVTLTWVGPNKHFISQDRRDITKKNGKLYRFKEIPNEIREAENFFVQLEIGLGGIREWKPVTFPTPDKSSSVIVETP